MEVFGLFFRSKRCVAEVLDVIKEEIGLMIGERLSETFQGE